ncbi:MAG: 3-hydroxyacyl-ACP dehydratase FabZ [Terriglobia bacterium]
MKIVESRDSAVLKNYQHPPLYDLFTPQSLSIQHYHHKQSIWKRPVLAHATGIMAAYLMPVMDIQAIREILPHRYPMLLVDRILELEEERIVGIKNVTANEPFFDGHFPDFPVMPGVLIIEAMAQVAGVLVLSSIPDRHTKLVLLASVEEAKFRKPVRPGDQLRIEMKVIKRKATIAKMYGTATVDGTVVAEAGMMCKLVDRD